MVCSIGGSSILDSNGTITAMASSKLMAFGGANAMAVLISPSASKFVRGVLGCVGCLCGLRGANAVSANGVTSVLVGLNLSVGQGILVTVLSTYFTVGSVINSSTSTIRLATATVGVVTGLVLRFAAGSSVAFAIVSNIPYAGFSVGNMGAIGRNRRVCLSVRGTGPRTTGASSVA